MNFASPSLADPLDSSPLLAGVLWVQDALLGTAAAIVATLAVAALGAAMLAGRVDVRRGGSVILGCFILFGAPAIAAGIRSTLSVGDESAAAREAFAPAAPAATPPPPLAAVPYDPYAGAAVPVPQ